jgi:hypothetical protein
VHDTRKAIRRIVQSKSRGRTATRCLSSSGPPRSCFPFKRLEHAPGPAEAGTTNRASTPENDNGPGRGMGPYFATGSVLASTSALRRTRFLVRR